MAKGFKNIIKYIKNLNVNLTKCPGLTPEAQKKLKQFGKMYTQLPAIMAKLTKNMAMKKQKIKLNIQKALRALAASEFKQYGLYLGTAARIALK